MSQHEEILNPNIEILSRTEAVSGQVTEDGRQEMRDGFAAEDAEKTGISNFKLQSEKCKGAGAPNPPVPPP